MVLKSCIIQVDIDVLVKWVEKWLLEFNPSKYEMIHCGNTNGARSYCKNCKVLRTIEEQRGLGV